jgi:hypothetical protein
MFTEEAEAEAEAAAGLLFKVSAVQGTVLPAMAKMAS